MRGGFRRIHTKPVLTADQVRRLKELRAQGMRLKQLPDAIGASKNTIWRALSGLGAYA